jgi:hypothetical protein
MSWAERGARGPPRGERDWVGRSKCGTRLAVESRTAGLHFFARGFG